MHSVLGILKDKGSVVWSIHTRDTVREALQIMADQGIGVTDCLALVTQKRVRHLPVLDNEALVGLVSIGDLVKGVIDEQRFIIERLENYVSG